MLLPFFAIGVLAVAVFSDKKHDRQAKYGYGESTLARIPTPLWSQGLAGLRGEHRSWRHPLPSVQERFKGNPRNFGIRGPTSSWRHPLPRPWEGSGPRVDAEELFGISTGAAGIRGVHLPAAFSPQQITAYNIDGAAQGLQGSSIAPPR